MVSWDSGSGSHQFGSVGEQQIADLFQINGGVGQKVLNTGGCIVGVETNPASVFHNRIGALVTNCQKIGSCIFQIADDAGTQGSQDEGCYRDILVLINTYASVFSRKKVLTLLIHSE